MHIKHFFLLSVLALLMAGACKNDTASGEQGEFKNGKPGASAKSAVYSCTLQSGYLMGVKLGMNVDTLAKKLKGGLTMEKLKTAKGEVETYIFQAANLESIRIYPIEKDGQKRVHVVEYAGSLCTTEKGAGVAMTLGDLRKLYPELAVHGSEEDGRTIATGEGWKFLLGTQVFTYGVDIDKMNQDIRVTAIVLQ
ncbi:MAG: hypothetical protein WCR52_03915 [Bacteroidota bacterium]